MRAIYPFMIALLVGCSDDSESKVDPSAEGSGGGTGESYYYDDGENGSSVCGDAYTVHDLSLPDGGTVKVKVPVHCNPYWVDRGDPPPDEVVQEKTEAPVYPPDKQIQPQVR